MSLVQVAAAALTTYDILVTLPWEIALVWHGHWGIPAITYMVNRYGVLVHSYIIVAVTPMIYSDPDPTATYCHWWHDIGLWSITIVNLLGEALLTMRVVAFFGQKRRVVIALWTIYGICAAIGIAMMGYGMGYTQIFAVISKPADTGPQGSGSASPSESVCIAALYGSAWIYWTPGMLMESVLIVCTLLRAYQYRIRGIKGRLVQVITQDHLLYFVGVFVLMVSNVSLCATPGMNSYYGLIVELTLCLNSILASRIFLNLRAAGHPESIATSTMLKDVDEPSPASDPC